ncbi:cytochrome-c peroxidase [Photobacterium sp. ZSDE20]|uniref:Cytochrome-c peroxidase n=1 Tax=Photobacterium pectinilyticum TaxID=2906793 RepID=A0ABT1N126_9GAMM|nr:cytochrome c peroxidase [Photobacterium sp. ZSDE20]MCQ1058433.1 cytochrome-c peroxidase [Photobacterium sp. ZSDE20]MDD1823156.1 cytochrome-c peroxidase [Photobacterium sp. ZSDE20]
MNNKTLYKRHRLTALVTASLLGLASGIASVHAEEEVEAPDFSGIGSLKGIDPAPVPGLDEYVKDEKAAIKLGKALFWDMQAGSQGQACASCHYSAGADNRTKNQISPGLNNVDPAKREIFDPTQTGVGGPNYTLVPEDFPFRVYANPDDRDSEVLFDTDDVVSSQGVFAAVFDELYGGSYGEPKFSDRRESCETVKDIFHVGGVTTRRVEPRNTPTVINAIFNFRNFWDGRANNSFNGVDPFGRRNVDAKVVHYDPYTDSVSLKKVDLINSSAASQAVGPPGSAFEMTCANKAFRDMGKKLLHLKALGLQQVDRTDSELGYMSSYPNKGLHVSYREMVEDAFNIEYWGSDEDFDGYSQMEENFSLFWGLAIQLYEKTLISDDSRFDRYMDGDDYALTDLEKHGMEVFVDKGSCVNCHSGPEFSKAMTHLIAEEQEEGLVERMHMGDGNTSLYDNGFYNIGVTPTKEDIGLGGRDPWDNPLSHTEQYIDKLLGNNAPDNFEVDPCTFEALVFEEDPCNSNRQTRKITRRVENGKERTAVHGAFKTPTLRNVELTGPFMHNGSMATLEQVVEFYNRGGNRTSEGNGDSSGFDGISSNLDPDIRSLDLTDYEKKALVAFMKSLTDERVRQEKAPFDHPQLFIPNGAVGDEFAVVQKFNDITAEEDWLEIPMVGAYGRPAKGLEPIKPFLNGVNSGGDAPNYLEAKDDVVSAKYGRTTVIKLLDNDVAGDYGIDPSSIVIHNAPSRTECRYYIHSDGSISITPLRDYNMNMTYTVKDSEGHESNVATVEINVYR